MTLGQRVAVMKDGLLQQVAPPMEVYRKPANAFVGGFVGSPAMNFLSCIPGGDGRSRLDCGAFSVTLDGGPARIPEGGKLVLGVRPHDVELVGEAEGEARARVDVVEPLGSELLVHLELHDLATKEEFRAVVPPETPAAVDEVVGIRFRPDRLHLFDAGSGERLN